VLLVNDWPKSEFHAPTLSAYVQWSFYSLGVASEETPILSKDHVYQSLIRLFWRSGTQVAVRVARMDVVVCVGFHLLQLRYAVSLFLVDVASCVHNAQDN